KPTAKTQPASALGGVGASTLPGRERVLVVRRRQSARRRPFQLRRGYLVPFVGKPFEKRLEFVRGAHAYCLANAGILKVGAKPTDSYAWTARRLSSHGSTNTPAIRSTARRRMPSLS